MKKYTAKDLCGRIRKGDRIEYEGFDTWMIIEKQGGRDKVRVLPETIEEASHEND